MRALAVSLASRHETDGEGPLPRDGYANKSLDDLGDWEMGLLPPEIWQPDARLREHRRPGPGGVRETHVCPGRYGIVVGSRVRGRSRDARPGVLLTSK